MKNCDVCKVGIYSIDITGGEPFTDKALFKKLNYVRSNNLKLTITSNNILIDKNSADLLKGSEVDYAKELIGNSFKINNPQTKSSCGCGVSFSL